MGMFRAREPRKFRRICIYTDERRDRLNKLVEDVKREQGESVPEKYDPTKFRGTFSEFTPHVQRQKDSGFAKLGWPVALILIIVLIFVWHFLLTGNIHF